MYQPIGLECGHKFCAQCAFNSAGKANALGSFQAILDHVSANAPCPQCRTPGAFVLAMNLKETGHLIRRRCDTLSSQFRTGIKVPDVLPLTVER
jgi:hypothetical protein